MLSNIAGRIILVIAGFYLMFQGNQTLGIRAESETDSSFGSISLVAEQLRTQGRLQIGLGIALIGFAVGLERKKA